MSEKKLSIIIVSYNTKVLTARTIESVLQDIARSSRLTASRQAQDDGVQIIVVDNNSKDGSVEYLHHRYGKKIQIIARDTNGGFAIANNEGIAGSTSEYLLLLNSDTIVQPGAIEAMVSAMDKHPKVGILSCRLENSDGSYQPQGGALLNLFNIAAWWLWPFPGNMPLVEAYQNKNGIERADTQVRPYGIMERGWVGGTAMMIRRSVIDQIGDLDEKIFMYAEDVDLCMRAKTAGWQVGITPDATITHLGSASSGSQSALMGEVRGLLYLWRKHFPAWQEPILRVIFLSGAILRWVLFGILRGDKRQASLYEKIFHLGIK